MCIYNVYMKERKDKEFHFRVSKNQLEIIEDIANSLSRDNNKNISLSNAIIESIYLTQRYLIKSKKYKPLRNNIKIENEFNEMKQNIMNKYEVNEEELANILSFNMYEN